MSEFYMGMKLCAGLHALDHLQGELKALGSRRPLLLIEDSVDSSAICRLFRRVWEDTPLDTDPSVSSDGLIACGGRELFQRAAKLVHTGGQRQPLALVPCASYSGEGLADLIGTGDLLILDERLPFDHRDLSSSEEMKSGGQESLNPFLLAWRQCSDSLHLLEKHGAMQRKRGVLSLLSLVSRDLAGRGDSGRRGRLPAYFEFSGRGQIVSGEGSLQELPRLLGDRGCKAPLFLSDRGIEAAGLCKTVEKVLNPAFAPAASFFDIPPDSGTELVEELADLYLTSGCDCIIALGGGSVIDTAKGVNILAGNPGTRLSDWAGAGKLQRPLPPLVAIPSTSGTGSEVTLVAVIADKQQGRKLLYTSAFLQADIAVLDPLVSDGLPATLTASTGMDALSHAIEAWYSLGHNPLSDSHALLAVQSIASYLPRVCKAARDKQSDPEGRLALSHASCLAGLAFSNSMVGMVHTLGHSLGALCHVPHGQCMSVLLPYGIAYNTGKLGADLLPLYESVTGESDLFRELRSCNADLEAKYSGYALSAAVRLLNETLRTITRGRHPISLSDLKDREGHSLVRESDLERVAELALGDGSGLYNPEEIDYEDMLRVLKAAFSGARLQEEKKAPIVTA